jgi:hypothetical protein
VTVPDGVIEDCGVRGEPRDRELLNVAAERAAGQQTPGDVVEPKALAHFAEFLSRYHYSSSSQSGAALGWAAVIVAVKKHGRGGLIIRMPP